MLCSRLGPSNNEKGTDKEEAKNAEMEIHELPLSMEIKAKNIGEAKTKSQAESESFLMTNIRRRAQTAGDKETVFIILFSKFRRADRRQDDGGEMKYFHLRNNR